MYEFIGIVFLALIVFLLFCIFAKCFSKESCIKEDHIPQWYTFKEKHPQPGEYIIWEGTRWGRGGGYVERLYFWQDKGDSNPHIRQIMMKDPEAGNWNTIKIYDIPDEVKRWRYK